MAFSIFGFQFNRGITTANAQGQAFTAVAHTYKSNVDTLAQITAPGYFPVNIEGTPDTDKVFVRDWLFIIDKDGNTSFVTIDSLDPVTLSADLFTAIGFNVVGPVAAVDQNGILISGTNVQLEFADATHNGILSFGAQIIGGAKTFPNGIKVNDIDGILPGDQIFIGNNQTDTITIGGATAGVFIPLNLITDRISSATGNLSIHTNMDGVTAIGQDTVSLTTGILTNRINPIAPNTNPLVIGNNTVFPVELGNATAPILVKGGVKWDIGGGTISSYAELNVGGTWSGPWAAGQPAGLILRKIENTVYLTSSRVPPQPAANNVFATTGAIIPVGMRPLQQVESLAQNVDNTTFVTGSIVVTTSGAINAFGNNQQGAFTAAGTAGIGDINLSWTTV